MWSLNINYDSCNSMYSTEKSTEQFDNAMKQRT